MDVSTEGRLLPPYLTVAQVAEQMQVTPPTVYGWIRKGHLSAAKLPGGGYRVQRQHLRSFVEALYEEGDGSIGRTEAVRAAALQGGRSRIQRNFFELGRCAGK